MKITPELMDTVAFLCARNEAGENVPGGTAFFVELPDETNPARMWTYLITAQHCLDEIEGLDVHVRINTLQNVDASKGYEDTPTKKDD